MSVLRPKDGGWPLPLRWAVIAAVLLGPFLVFDVSCSCRPAHWAGNRLPSVYFGPKDMEPPQ